MPQLTRTQVAQYAYNAGFRGTALNTAVAVAMAESSGNTSAYNPESAAGTRPGSGSRGLWQIYGQAHPEYNNASMFDPQQNANAAFKVYSQAGNHFTPWSTYNQNMLGMIYNMAAGIGNVTRGTTKMTTSDKAQKTIGKVSGIPVKSATRATPVNAVANGVNSWQDLLSLPTVGSTRAGAEPAKQSSGNIPSQIYNVLGVQPSGDPHPQNITDIIFIFLGASFVLIGLIFLFSTGLAGFKKDGTT
jgi:Lysozyme like domain